MSAPNDQQGAQAAKAGSPGGVSRQGGGGGAGASGGSAGANSASGSGGSGQVAQNGSGSPGGVGGVPGGLGGLGGGAASGGAPGGGAPGGGAAGGRAAPQYSQADLNRIVLEYLNKKGYHRTESMLRLESLNTPTPAAPLVTPATAAYPPAGELSRREKELRDKASRSEREVRELRERQQRIERELRDTRDREVRLQKEKELREVRALEEKRKRESSPELYHRAYLMLRLWVDALLDLYKPELTRVMYPIFVHCFLELIARGFVAELKVFLDRFRGDHEVLHALEVRHLSALLLAEHLGEDALAQAYRTHRYTVVVSKTTLNLLLFFLHENETVGGLVLIRIINQYLNAVVLTTKPDRQDLEGEANPEEGIPGFTASNTNALEAFNESEVRLGRYPLDGETQRELELELRVKDERRAAAGAASGGSGSGGTTLVEEFSRMTAAEPDLPQRDLLPLPPKDAADLRRMMLAVEDLRSKIRLAPRPDAGGGNVLSAAAPLVCMYTFHNTNNDLTSLAFNEDLNLVAGGFQDLFVKLWLLDGKPLRLVFKRDSANHDTARRLVGHSGPVYGVSFLPDNRYLLSGSEDKTVRLWLLDLYTLLVLYRGHNQPVWDVKFLPLGHYFATALHDQTARLWATDHIYPLRIFAGHINDVDCVEFHPNSSYVFTGLLDKTCRMWDVQTGSCVRILWGHTGPVNCMAVLPDGRWLASAGEDSVINVWDIGLGRKLKTMRGHGRSLIYLLAFLRDGEVLCSGGADNTVRVWDVKRNTTEAAPEPEPFAYEEAPPAGDDAKRAKQPEKSRKEILATSDHMTAYFTKKTPVFKVHFTRRNLCYAGGTFQG
jgi:transcription initiation factor TFIID subunit 5